MALLVSPGVPGSPFSGGLRWCFNGYFGFSNVMIFITTLLLRLFTLTEISFSLPLLCKFITPLLHFNKKKTFMQNSNKKVINTFKEYILKLLIHIYF